MLSYVNEQGIELVSFSYENSFIYPVTPSTLKEARWKTLIILSKCNEKENFKIIDTSSVWRLIKKNIAFLPFL